MLFELRQYRIKPGRQADWVEFMENVIIPFQQSKGMVILGSFTQEDDETVYVWIRRLIDEAEREAQYEAVYQSDEWTNEIGPRDPGHDGARGHRRPPPQPHAPLRPPVGGVRAGGRCRQLCFQ